MTRNNFQTFYLAGLWGSAFAILIRRLLEDNRGLEPGEIRKQDNGKCS